MQNIRLPIMLVALGFSLATQAMADDFQWPFGPAPSAMTGRALYQSRCGGCHALDRNKYGPSHHNVFGRTAGTQPGYHYSSALVRSGVVWNEQTLDRWLEGPRKMVPGTRMDESVTDVGQRRLIIDFLKKQSESPSTTR